MVAMTTYIDDLVLNGKNFSPLQEFIIASITFGEHIYFIELSSLTNCT